jgi:6-phosphogluconolactonase
MSSNLIFVGTYTDSIHTLRFDLESGALEPVRATHGGANPSYLILHPRLHCLYAVNESLEYEGRFGGAVSAYRIDPRTGELTLLSIEPTHGADPCHLCIDPTGRFLVVANYTSGHVTVLPVRDDGGLASASQVIAHEGHSVDPERQTSAHCHFVGFDPQGEHLFVCDLGLDQVVSYRFDRQTGALEQKKDSVHATPGVGPRQIALHPTAPHAYILNEIVSSITQCAWDRSSGRLQALSSAPLLPKEFRGESHGAELRIAPSGRFLYASNRGHDSIAIFAIDPVSGMLSPRGHEPTQGGHPRHFGFSLDENFLIVANRDADDLVVLRTNAKTGSLSSTGRSVKLPRPVCVLFAPYSI